MYASLSLLYLLISSYSSFNMVNIKTNTKGETYVNKNPTLKI